MTKNAKGEVTTVFEGKTYILVPDFNALCDFEAATGLNAISVFNNVSEAHLSASTARALVQACLNQRHPGELASFAGKLMDNDPSIIADLLGGQEADASAGKLVDPPTPKRKSAKRH
ncbi:GTA-gp10 family protein [Ketogulonicigenium vulgare]|uniref:GTA-gp10 family protein n=1 Tax=Ketogulonicigenium vulgare TaxID=92945 RepID=UPI0023589F81|nr:GTA-gp10 family protein [Ketogulonicigenium vulgare]